MPLEYALQHRNIFTLADPYRQLPIVNQINANSAIGVKHVGQQYVKAQMKGHPYAFNLMVVGESGLGKSTFVNSLFSSDLVEVYSHQILNKTTHIEKKTFELQENNVTLKLSIIDTPGFGDSLNREKDLEPIINYIESQYDIYHENENTSQFRQRSDDNRVHALIYFISPHTHSLKELDFTSLKVLSSKVNVIPVIAKADSLTLEEKDNLKQAILRNLEKYDIKIYPTSHCDDTDEVQSLFDKIPFSVIGANSVINVNGKKSRGRQYKWGVVDIENEINCDFIALRQLLLQSCLHDLAESTHSIHYYNYRMGRLRALGRPVSLLKSDEQFDDQIDNVRRRYHAEMAKKEEEMRLAFFQKVKEKEAQLKEAEEALHRREREMFAELEEQRRILEAEEKEIELAIQRNAASKKGKGVFQM